jgi:hypothetical protein
VEIILIKFYKNSLVTCSLMNFIGIDFQAYVASGKTIIFFNACINLFSSRLNNKRINIMLE